MAIHESVSHKLTYRDYLLFPEDGNRHELIDGEHFVAPAPSWKHQMAVSNLNYFFVEFLRRNSLGKACPAPFEVVLSDQDIVQPDLLFISNERSRIRTDKNAEGVPDLVIEVLSESTRKIDETRKLRLYERAGAREYWMFDTARESARVYRQEGDRLVLAQELSAAAGDLLETPLLPGLRIPLAEVFL
ncbi:MAG TPA: Uma2 family endonuclease [Thermoanaerobaculia bacterium]|nr:Uma2 family endonuclease [Thermoanaerobaculia bacterium]